MANQTATSARVVHAMKFLEVHFGEMLKVDFRLQGIPVPAGEIFSPNFLLSAIAQRADRASCGIYSRSIISSVEKSESACTGEVVHLVDDLQSVDLILLVASAEDLFGIDANDVSTDRVIEITSLC